MTVIDPAKLEVILQSMVDERKTSHKKCSKEDRCDVCEYNKVLFTSPLLAEAIGSVVLEMILGGPDLELLMGLLQLGMKIAFALKEAEVLEKAYGASA